jgi:hypothetical protein
MIIGQILEKQNFGEFAKKEGALKCVEIQME